MSKDVKIKEGNISPTFYGVKKIKTNSTSGSVYWVPEDETKLGTKHINENGTYKASEEVDEQGQSKNWYGYSEVTVSGVGVASGINPATGNEAVVKPDSDGNLPDSPVDVPSYIGFIVPPEKGIRIPYEDGEEITLAGAVVGAFMKANGSQWEGDEEHPHGFIPLEEITVNPTKADAESAGDPEKRSDFFDFDFPIVAEKKITIIHQGGYAVFGRIGLKAISGQFVTFFKSNTYYYFVLASENPFDVYIMIMWSGSWGEGNYTDRQSDLGIASSTIDGKTVYYTTITQPIDDEKFSLPDAKLIGEEFDTDKFNKVAWTMIYGDDVGGKQTIDVMWERVGDQKVLKTTLDVYVEKAESEPEEQ